MILPRHTEFQYNWNQVDEEILKNHIWLSVWLTKLMGYRMVDLLFDASLALCSMYNYVASNCLFCWVTCPIAHLIKLPLCSFPMRLPSISSSFDRSCLINFGFDNQAFSFVSCDKVHARKSSVSDLVVQKITNLINCKGLFAYNFEISYIFGDGNNRYRVFYPQKLHRRNFSG